ncbi:MULTISPECIES: Tn3 family transposase [Ralstonia]|jgi:TnpA family transposase|nr:MULTISPECIES: Tn3 family transposase [Ralstonia]MBB0179440.1 Tn3 family transposase [Ralstonia pickettii]MBB0203057.1 Tn3 family transposase [Ralstonia pickettii]MBX3808283.1 Tn3 family transposase [Ralstonia pickettii]MBX3918167.1 Tn3 family transposase [Ralstonia pickettii]MDR9385706.1 Tn3 family transposase [Ralstonia sp. 11b]
MPGLEFRYVGRDSLPTRLSEFDVEQYFALTASDIAAINQKFRRAGRAGAAIQLIFLRASGHTLDQLNTLPRQLLRYVGEKLGVETPTIASLRTIYQRYPTLYEHQVWACQYLGLTRIDDDQWTGLEAWMRQDAAESLTLDELVQHAHCWLYERRILIPSTRSLQDVARSIWAGIERDLLATIEAVVPLVQIAQAEAAVFAQHAASGTTVLEWLKTPPARHSPSTMSETLAKIRFLKDLGAHTWAFDAIPIEKQRAYGQRIQARRPAKVRELKASTRTIELVFFLRVTLLELTDAMLYQTGRRVSDLVRQAYNKTTTKQARSAVEYRQQLVEIKGLVDDTRRSAEERLADIGKLLEGLSAKPPASHAASVRETLTEDHHRIRNLIAPLRELEFASNGNDPAMRQLEFIGSLHDQGATELPPDCNVPVSVSWRDLVDGEDRKCALRAMEASAIMGLRKGLRRGTVWISHSLSFRERDQLLIPPAQWESERDRYLSSLGLPNQADTYLNRLTDHLKAGLAALDEAREAGHFTIDATGVLHLSPLEAAETDGTPMRTRDLLFKDIGSAQFADMILEMDARTNFSEVLLARKARDAHELISLYAALIAHGTELEAKGVAAMIPQLDTAHVSTAMRALEMPGRLRRANERVVEFQRTHPITELWGTGQQASSDSMSLDTSPYLFYARADPRRRTHAVGIYTHVLDQHGIAYNQPMVLNERQTGVAIEGVIRHNETRTDGGLLRLAVDTHGYTNVGMAVSKLLGFDLCPWLRNLAERKLYLPRGLQVADGLTAAVSHDISLKAIRDGWDGLLRLVASIYSGRVSAIVALQRFGSAAQGDPIHRAADHLGKMLRTLFLCDFFSNTEFRRELRTLLNRGESVHQLQRAIYSSKVPHDRGRRQDEMIAISGSLTLLTNLVIAWNTQRMQATVDTWRRKGQRIDDDWLRRMGPAHFAHVNFRGILSFPIHLYQDSLLEAAPRRRASGT